MTGLPFPEPWMPREGPLLLSSRLSPRGTRVWLLGEGFSTSGEAIVPFEGNCWRG